MAKVSKHAFCKFVYPFTFDPADFESLSHRIPLVNVGQCSNPWEHAEFPREELLEHTARFLNPDPQLNEPATGQLWQLRRNKALFAYDGIGAQADWSLRIDDNQEIKFKWESVQLALFRHGVGFLIIDVQPIEDKSDVWLDFVHHFRFARGRRSSRLAASRKRGPDQFESFFPHEKRKQPCEPDNRCLDNIIGLLLDPLFDETVEDHPVHSTRKEIFVAGKMLPHIGLFLDQVDSEAELHEITERTRCSFHSHQPLQSPETTYCEDQRGVIEYAKQHWFLFSIDGSAFVGAPATPEPFFIHTLPDHIRKQYFFVYLIALYQRFALIRLKEKLASRWLVDIASKRWKGLRQLNNQLLDFEARGYFTQVMQRDNHNRCYQKWLEVFQIPELRSDLNEQVQRLYEQEASDRTESLQRIVELFTVIGAVPAFVFGFFNLNIKGVTSNGVSISFALVLALVSILLGLGIVQIARRWRR